MEYRRFGKTDLKVSAIGFGCWEIGGTYGRIDESQFAHAVQSAIDNGINCFDTAEAYGMGVSERAVAPCSWACAAACSIARWPAHRHISAGHASERPSVLRRLEHCAN